MVNYDLSKLEPIIQNDKYALYKIEQINAKEIYKGIRLEKVTGKQVEVTLSMIPKPHVIALMLNDRLQKIY